MTLTEEEQEILLGTDNLEGRRTKLIFQEEDSPPIEGILLRAPVYDKRAPIVVVYIKETIDPSLPESIQHLSVLNYRGIPIEEVSKIKINSSPKQQIIEILSRGSRDECEGGLFRPKEMNPALEFLIKEGFLDEGYKKLLSAEDQFSIEEEEAIY